MLTLPEFALLRRPLLLLLGGHHAPNLPTDILPDHFHLLLLRFVAQRRVLLHRLDLLLGVVAYRLDLFLLLIRQVQRRIIFRRVRAHRSRTPASLCRASGRTSRMRRRRTATLSRLRHAQPSQAQRQTANHHHSPDRFHKTPCRPSSHLFHPLLFRHSPTYVNRRNKPKVPPYRCPTPPASRGPEPGQEPPKPASTRRELSSPTVRNP